MPLSPAQMRRLVHAIAFGEDPAASAPSARGAARLARQHARWWDAANVVGLCFAPKVRRGRLEEPSLQVWVRAKRPAHRLPAHRRVPASVSVEPLGLRGKVATDVQEVGVSALEALVSPRRPARPGFNTGHARGGAGTLGCAVRSLTTGELLALSCAHVVALHGQASPGERVLVPSLDAARARGVLGQARFGQLVAVGPLSPAFDQATHNVDAATVRPTAAGALEPHIALLDVTPRRVRPEVSLGTEVRKVGAATELTTGLLRALHLVASFPFPGPDGRARPVWFTDLLGVSVFTSGGDSGALVLDTEGAAVGLHMGSFEGMSVCMPIQRVLDAVGCTLP